MRLLLITLLLTGVAGLAAGQVRQPYQNTRIREGIILGGSIAGIGSSYLLQHRYQPFTESDVAALTLDRVPSFERFVTRQYSAGARDASDWLLRGSALCPLLLLADPDIRQDAGDFVLLSGETFLCTIAFTQLAKEGVHRTRPYVYNTQAPLSEKVKRDARRSFFSGHTSTVACLTFTSARIWSDYHPDSPARPWVWAGAAIWPAVTGYFRVKGGKHFVTDVLAGYAVGALTGIMLPKLHLR